MATRVPILILALTWFVACAQTSEPTPERQSMRREIAANFKQEFRYNPASDQPQASEEVPAANDEIVKLDPYTVNATTDKISQSIHADLLKIKTEQFNWEKGGTILKAGPVQIRWGYDPETGQLELFKLRF